MLRSLDVLVVDDRITDADVTLLALRRAAPEAKVLWLQSGNEALQFLFRVGEYRSGPHALPRLIMLDVDMPVMSGLSTLDLLRSHPHTARIPVALLTDGPLPLIMRRGDTFDAHTYIARALDLEKYCLQIRRLLDRWLPKTRARSHLSSTSAAAMRC